MILAASLCATPAAAQSYGQWSWDAEIGGGERIFDNFVDGEATTSYTERRAQFSLGINGFILHPTITDFRIRLDAALTRYDARRSLDSDLLGGSADIRLFTDSIAPSWLYFSRQEYSFEQPELDAPLHYAGLPGDVTTWGGQTRLVRGPLRGLLLGAQFSELGFYDNDATQRNDWQVVQWSRSAEKAQHSIKLKRWYRDYASVDFATEDYTLNIDEHATFGSGWRWDLGGIGIHTILDLGNAPASEVDSFRLNNTLLRTFPAGSRFFLTYNAGFERASEAPTIQSHNLSVNHLWPIAGGWQVGPIASMAWQKLDGNSVQAPRGGLTVIWNGRLGAFTVGFNATGGYGRITRDYPSGESLSEKHSELSGSFSLRHRENGGLHEELEAEWGRNQLSAAGRSVDELPDLGVGIGGFGTEDRLRTRLTLGHRWGSLYASAYGEWRRRKSVEEHTALSYDLQLLEYAANLKWAQLEIGATAGDGTLEQTGEQQISYLTATLQWRPWRHLFLRALYRTDAREVNIGPDLDFERFEASATLSIGKTQLVVRAFETTERSFSSTERTNRTIIWTLSRRFGGWLPIVSAPQRRGVIR